MNLTFDPISKQPFFVGMIKMCHQVRGKRLLKWRNCFVVMQVLKTKALRSWIVKDPFVKIGFHPTPLKEEIVVPPTADNSAEVKVFVHRPKRLKGPRWCTYICAYVFQSWPRQSCIYESIMTNPPNFPALLWFTFTEEVSSLAELTSSLDTAGGAKICWR